MADISIGRTFFAQKGWKPFPFQEEVWRAYLEGKSGLLNAPTGSGKTYSLWLPVLMEYIQQNPDYLKPKKNGLQIIWITPLRALAQDIKLAMEQVCEALDLPWQVAVRSGDTTSAERQKQKRNMPECLITTPESLHLLLSQKDSHKLFSTLKSVVVDEWHELLGNKRGVQIELALSKIKSLTDKPLKIWGISATIGNLEQAKEVLLGSNYPESVSVIADINKKIVVKSILPPEVEQYPWGGHLGIKMLPEILPIIEKSKTTLLFTNTRSQTEMWYQKILEFAPELSGLIAMHHGSLDNDVRAWVEEALHQGKLKLVVCTSSLDLGVDFRPVETVIQVGGPKGVARFAQRAGRSGHQPGAQSMIYFLPTNSLELIESIALQKAIKNKRFEDRIPLEKSFDTLIQYLVTLAVGEGFEPNKILDQIKTTFCFKEITDEEWQWVLKFITDGGESLSGYDEYAKVSLIDGKYKVENKKIALRHRLSIGTIVSDPMLKVKYMTGGYIGQVEESFISKIKKGDVFFFAGRSLEFIQIKEMQVLVRRSNRKTGIVPRWMGGRMPLSSQLSNMIREELHQAALGRYESIELQTIQPILETQQRLSIIPDLNTLLIEYVETKEGHHLFIYPFEGRFVHEVLSSLIAYRISLDTPIPFSIAMNDYGFELLSDEPIPIEEALSTDLFSMNNLLSDIYASINQAEMAKRKFRDIASIAGLIFQGFPGKGITQKHLQASSGILYGVFEQYDPENLLLYQAKEEVLTVQLEKERLIKAMQRINQQKIHLQRCARPTPFAFPIMVDRLRAKLSSEKLEDRIAKMQAALLK